MERYVRVVLPNGKEEEWEPTHRPVSVQNGSTLSMTWELEDGSVFSVAINMENVAALEMAATRDEQNKEVVDLIDKAKALDAREGE